MKWKRELGKIKTCPRCGLQYMEGLESCPDCGLIFSRLEIATNADAKKKIKRFDFDYIIKTNKLPSDVSYLKLLLFSIFFGYLGGHCFYVGRYFRGTLLLVDFLCLMCLTIFNSSIASIGNGSLLGTLTTICGFILLLWMWDIIMIITKRFKVPVAIDLESERALYEKEQNRREQFFKEVKEITLSSENSSDANKDVEDISNNKDEVKTDASIEENLSISEKSEKEEITKGQDKK